MNSHIHIQGSLAIVYDADCVEQPVVSLFDPEFWQENGGLSGEAEGRGSALFLETEFGPAVLRQYLRGGWPAWISHDRYFFAGLSRSRPVAEFSMLEKLFVSGLPVPRPLTALCRREGLFYTGALMTRRILHVSPLAELLDGRSNDPELWRRTGACIRRFHDRGVVHADLNARNILVGPGDSIHLIDFDRARFAGQGSRAFGDNLRRLRRSLEKLWPGVDRDRIETSWTWLLGGYQGI